MAEVYLNGQMLGTLWKAPYAIDITPALKKKGNKLEVRVTNLWANRVIGDKQPDKKKRYAWASYNNAFRASSKPPRRSAGRRTPALHPCRQVALPPSGPPPEGNT